MELHIRDVSKTYSNGVQALKDVTLTIPVGMYGLLGPNGSGKSTLMRTIATLQEPDEGSIRLGAIDVLKQKDEVRKTLGYLPQSFGFHPKARAERLLEHFAVLEGITERGGRDATSSGRCSGSRTCGRCGGRGSTPSPAACVSASASRWRSWATRS